MSPRFIKANDQTAAERATYRYRKLVSLKEQPYNFIQIEAFGAHPARRIVHGIRNYYVVSGGGTFIVEGDERAVEPGTLIVIQPGEVYSYVGTMELVEFNIPTNGQIAHEDSG